MPHFPQGDERDIAFRRLLAWTAAFVIDAPDLSVCSASLRRHRRWRSAAPSPGPRARMDGPRLPLMVASFCACAAPVQSSALRGQARARRHQGDRWAGPAADRAGTRSSAVPLSPSHRLPAVRLHRTQARATTWSRTRWSWTAGIWMNTERQQRRRRHCSRSCSACSRCPCRHRRGDRDPQLPGLRVPGGVPPSRSRTAAAMVQRQARRQTGACPGNGEDRSTRPNAA